MQSEVDVLVHALSQEKDKAQQAARRASRSKLAWVAFTVVISVLIGAWFAGYQARKYYALGMEAGILTTSEGRMARALESDAHLECDAQGRNCVNK